MPASRAANAHNSNMDEALARHCMEINRCNQRGGRMLSIFDLLDAESLDLDLAAFLMARVSRGTSFMVGARPGGAGKTAVMCALLSLLPRDCDMMPATSSTVCAATPAPRRCYVCHEIGSGPYFSYLWNADLRAYCALSEQGHILATNLHADDLDEAREQVCGQNRVPEAHFNAFGLVLFLRVRGGYAARRHWIETVYASDGKIAHSPVFEAQRGLAPGLVSDPYATQCRAFLEKTHEQGVRLIEDTREAVAEFISANPQ